MTQPIEKKAAVNHFIDRAKQATGVELKREALDVVLAELIDLASRKEWWSSQEYPAPIDGELQARYLIHEDADNTFALYLNVMKPGKAIFPHNHTTWACIAAVEGTETNYVYDRTDDGSKTGVATLAMVQEKPVGPGQGIALMPEDIHAVKILDESGIRHLHMYGLALEKLTERLVFDTETNTYKTMSVGVKTQRSQG